MREDLRRYELHLASLGASYARMKDADVPTSDHLRVSLSAQNPFLPPPVFEPAPDLAVVGVAAVGARIGEAERGRLADAPVEPGLGHEGVPVERYREDREGRPARRPERRCEGEPGVGIDLAPGAAVADRGAQQELAVRAERVSVRSPAVTVPRSRSREKPTRAA